MDGISLYLFSYILLLVSGVVILRYLVRRDYLKRGELSPFIAFLQMLQFFVYGGFPYLYLPNDWPTVTVSPALHITGVFLVFTGLAIIFYGMLRLGIRRSLGRGTTQLKQSGVYRITRNPQVMACGLYVIGFLMLWPSWRAAGWAFLYFVFSHMMVLTEEDHLRNLHGRKYQDYCEEVPRYFEIQTLFRHQKARKS